MSTQKTIPQVHWTRFSPGETIFRQGFPALGWYILCRGRAKLFLRTAQGKRLILRFGKPGDLLNPTVFGPHSFSAEAIDHCRIGFVDRDRVLFLLREHPELLKEALGRLSLWEECLAQRLEDLVALSVRERLVRALLELGGNTGSTRPRASGSTFRYPSGTWPISSVRAAKRYAMSYRGSQRRVWFG